MSYDTLVLSGGGLKGYYLLGAVQCAIDNFLVEKVDKYVGTSIGACLCYFFAIGYSPIEIVTTLYEGKWVDKPKYFDVFSMANGNGATKFTDIQECLEQMTIHKIGKLITLKMLKEEYGKTLVCVTFNMTTGRTEYLSHDNYPDMPCLTALRMSCNIPIVFDRFKYLDNYYIDGGISDNFPVEKGQEIGEKVLGINMILSLQTLQDRPEEGIMSYITKLLYIPNQQNARRKMVLANDKCTIIQIETFDNFSMMEFTTDVKSKLDMFSGGYTVVKKFLGLDTN
jgi:predicted acylesterase/phospholipase RssA